MFATGGLMHVKRHKSRCEATEHFRVFFWLLDSVWEWKAGAGPVWLWLWWLWQGLRHPDGLLGLLCVCVCWGAWDVSYLS